MVRSFRLAVVVAVVLCTFGEAWAQDRSRSRYIPSSEDEGTIDVVESPKPQRSQQNRRIPSQRTRPTLAPPEDEVPVIKIEKISPRRSEPQPEAPSYVEPAKATISHYQQENPESIPEVSTSAPANTQPGRRKRPKKRRKPKPEQKPEVAKSVAEEFEKQPKEAERGYLDFQPNLPPNEYRPIAPDGTPIHYVRDVDPYGTGADDRNARSQNFQPQHGHNRLPPELPKNLRDTDQILKLREAQPKPSEADGPQVRYPSVSQDGAYRGEYHQLQNRDQPQPQVYDEDNLPGRNQRIPEPAQAEVRLPPTEQPLIVPLFEEPNLNYDSLTRQSAQPTNPNVEEASPRDARHPIPTNRLPTPAQVNYRAPENADNIEKVDSQSTAETVKRDLNDDDFVPERLPGDALRRSLPYQREPTEYRQPSNSRNIPRQAEESRSAPPLTRTGSRYQPSERDNLPVPIDAIEAEVPRQVPRPQRSGSRYQNNEDIINERAQGEPERPSRQRADSQLTRTGSRYQQENPELARYNPSRAVPQPEVNSVPVEPRPRPRSERTRTRVVQPEPEVVAPQAIPATRTSERAERRPQRTRSRYQPQPAIEPPEDSIPAQAEPVPHRSVVPTRSRSRYQPQYQPESVEIQDVNPEEFQRSRPVQPEHVIRRPQPQALPPPPPLPPQPAEYVPEYQPVIRTTQRRPDPRPSTPVQVENTRPSRQNQRSHQQQALAGRPVSQPVTKSQFQCPDPYGFFPDENQCDKYYECRNDTAEEGLCSDGLAFNLISAPTYLRCDSVRDIDCSKRPELQTPQPTKNCPRRFGLFPDEKDCTKFWHCVDGTSTQVQCPPGLVYDDSKGTCNWADLVEKSCSTEDLLGFECPEATPAQLQDGVYTRYAHPQNCQLHFTCIKGTDGKRRPRMLSCNDGFVFDPETGHCTKPEEVPGCEEFYGKPKRASKREPVEPEEEPETRTTRRRRPNQRTRS